MSNLTEKCCVSQAPQTVKQAIDEAIKQSRIRTEQLCINKAKLETLGLLDMPFSDLHKLLNVCPF